MQGREHRGRRHEKAREDLPGVDCESCGREEAAGVGRCRIRGKAHDRVDGKFPQVGIGQDTLVHRRQEHVDGGVALVGGSDESRPGRGSGSGGRASRGEAGVKPRKQGDGGLAGKLGEPEGIPVRGAGKGREGGGGTGRHEMTKEKSWVEDEGRVHG